MRLGEQMEHLLDDLTRRAGLSYLSDLRCGSCHSRLLPLVACMAPEDYTVEQWRAAVSYITKAPADGCGLEELRQELLDALSS